MDSTNSKITRVQPVFKWLHDNGGSNWPDRFLHLVTGFAVPIKAGELLRMDLDPEREAAASPARLAWMLRNANRLAPKDGRLWEELKHRTSDTPKVEAALKLLEHGETQGLGKRRLEGKTHADCLLECDHAPLFRKLIPHTAFGLQRRTWSNDNPRRRALQPTAATIRPMKKPNQRSLTQKAVKAMTDAVAKVVKDHRRRGRPLAVWRNGKASWIPADEVGASHDSRVLSRTK